MFESRNISCRFYADKLPSIDDVVMAKVTSIADLGAYAQLIEYNNIEGMIMLSELSRRRIRSVNKLLRVGRVEYVAVTRVDKEMNYIDLSKRRVTKEEALLCQERYSKAKCVYGILRRVAEVMEYSTCNQFEDLYRKTAWHFDLKYKKKTRSYDVFKMAVSDSNVLDECDIDSRTKEVLLATIAIKLPQNVTKLRATLEITCFEYEGIDAIKKSLMAGKACSTEDNEIRINLIAPPLFVMNLSSDDGKKAQKLMEQAMSAIDETIKTFGGTFKLVTGPKEVTDQDEKNLAEMFEKLNLEKEEMGNSESSDDEDDDRFMFESHPY